MGVAFDPERIARKAKSRAISSFRGKLPNASLKVYDDLVGLSKSVKKARNDTINDARRRIPGKLATVVTQYYGIKKSEIMPNKGAKAAANISNAYEKGIVYTGRLLTPTLQNEGQNVCCAIPKGRRIDRAPQSSNNQRRDHKRAEENTRE